MNNPYLNFLYKIGNIYIYRVNGKWIRENIDLDFTNFGQHYRFNFIPENEFWIDIELTGNETCFYIYHLLTEYKLMKDGFSYEGASEVAKQVERNERYKSKKFKKYFDTTNYDAKVNIVKKNFIGNKAGINIWLVDGELVRDFWYIDFTAGGHDLVYSWIPKNEIWIDDDLKEDEICFTILHEFIERILMNKGDSYLNAHQKALEIEFNKRQTIQKVSNIEKEKFVKQNIGSGLAIKKKGRWGTYHWEILIEKGDYQKSGKIVDDTEEGTLEKYFDKYVKN